MAVNRKYTNEMLRAATEGCDSISDVLRNLGLRLAGGNFTHITRRLAAAEIDISHFNGKAANRGMRHVGGNERKSAATILVLREDGIHTKPYLLRRALIDIGVPEECAVCAMGPTWNGRRLLLQIDHINGRRWDNRPENIRFLCPNCHSQTDNFGSKNKALLLDPEDLVLAV